MRRVFLTNSRGEQILVEKNYCCSVPGTVLSKASTYVTDDLYKVTLPVPGTSNARTYYVRGIHAGNMDFGSRFFRNSRGEQILVKKIVPTAIVCSTCRGKHITDDLYQVYACEKGVFGRKRLRNVEGSTTRRTSSWFPVRTNARIRNIYY